MKEYQSELYQLMKPKVGVADCQRIEMLDQLIE